MKQGIKYTITILAGLALGTGGAWALAGRGVGKADIVSGSWTTSLGYGTKSTDPFTRAGVARRGLLALPATETVYWQAAVDAEGKPLDGSCRYAMTGAALDTRWWSVTVYDTAGYLMPLFINPIMHSMYIGIILEQDIKSVFYLFASFKGFSSELSKGKIF